MSLEDPGSLRHRKPRIQSSGDEDEPLGLVVDDAPVTQGTLMNSVVVKLALFWSFVQRLTRSACVQTSYWYNRHFIKGGLDATASDDLSTSISDDLNKKAKQYYKIGRVVLLIFVCSITFWVSYNAITASRIASELSSQERLKANSPFVAPLYVYSSSSMTVARFPSADDVSKRILSNCDHVGVQELGVFGVFMRLYGTPNRTVSHIATMDNILDINERILKTNGAMLRFVMPKMWNSTLERDRTMLEQTEFNPCIISLKLDADRVFHMINPLIVSNTNDPSDKEIRTVHSDYTIIRERLHVYPFLRGTETDEDDPTWVRRKTKVDIRYRDFASKLPVLVTFENTHAYIIQLAIDIADNGHVELLKRFAKDPSRLSVPIKPIQNPHITPSPSQST
jgi:hypothetical protein